MVKGRSKSKVISDQVLMPQFSIPVHKLPPHAATSSPPPLHLLIRVTWILVDCRQEHLLQLVIRVLGYFFKRPRHLTSPLLHLHNNWRLHNTSYKPRRSSLERWFDAEGRNNGRHCSLLVRWQILQWWMGNAGWRGGNGKQGTTQVAPQTSLEICFTVPFAVGALMMLLVVASSTSWDFSVCKPNWSRP